MCIPVRQHIVACPVKKPDASKGPVTVEDVQMVQALIERCLQHYMSREQTIQALSAYMIDPRFTALVWNRLENENAEFFQTYHDTCSSMAAMQQCSLTEV